MECDVPEPCKFPSLASCQERFLWTHKEADLAPHPVVGLVTKLPVCKTRSKFPTAQSTCGAKVSSLLFYRCRYLSLQERESALPSQCRFCHSRSASRFWSHENKAVAAKCTFEDTHLCLKFANVWCGRMCVCAFE